MSAFQGISEEGLESAGDHGAWNDRVQHAGVAGLVGERIIIRVDTSSGFLACDRKLLLFFCPSCPRELTAEAELILSWFLDCPWVILAYSFLEGTRS